MRCNFCGREIPDDATICNFCKEKVGEARLCPKCLNPIPAQKKICPLCGALTGFGKKPNPLELLDPNYKTHKRLKDIFKFTGIVVGVEIVLMAISVLLYKFAYIKFFGILFVLLSGLTLATLFKMTIEISNIEKINFFLRFLPMFLLLVIAIGGGMLIISLGRFWE